MDWYEISVDDIRKNRPDLYQEIVEDVLMSGFAGRSDEVLSIVLPAINEMRAEIKTMTDQLKYDLESIVEKEARKKFKKIVSDIEKATTYKLEWRETEKRKIRAEILREIKEQQQQQQQEISSHINRKIEKPSKVVTTPKIRHTSVPNQRSANIGDEIFYCGQKCRVISKRVSGGMQRLLLCNEYNREFSILDSPYTYKIID